MDPKDLFKSSPDMLHLEENFQIAHGHLMTQTDVFDYLVLFACRINRTYYLTNLSQESRLLHTDLCRYRTTLTVSEAPLAAC